LAVSGVGLSASWEIVSFTVLSENLWSLDIVELVTLHGDVLSKVFIAVHSGGESDLGETSGNWDVLGVRENLSGLGAVWRFCLGDLRSGYYCDDGSKNLIYNF